MVTTMLITYNHEPYIAKAIESVISQECRYNHKILLSDDYSTDDTPNICKYYKKKYPSKIILQLNKKNYGPEQHWWKMFNRVNSKYTAYLDGDDYWCDIHKLEKQITKLEENLDCIYSCHNTIYNSKNLNYAFVSEDILTGIYTLSTFKYRSHTSSRLFRTDAVKEKLLCSIDAGDAYMQAFMLSIGNVYYFSDKMSIYNYTGAGAWSKLSVYEQNNAIHEVKEYMKNKFGYIK